MALVDRRMLEGLTGRTGLRGLALGGTREPVHLDLTAAAVMSAQFTGFAGRLGVASPPIAIEVPFDDAVGDPVGLVLARERLRLLGMRWVLDQVSHQALLASRPEVLEPSLLKLVWAAGMAEPGIAAALAAAVRRVGAGRMVLMGCDTEAALVWGLSRGIGRFQGRFVDSMLAAERLRTCGTGLGCALSACRARAGAVVAAGREGCGDMALLDG